MAEFATKTIKCPVFDGRPEQFRSWYVKFEAYAGGQGIEEAINKTIDPRMPDRFDSAADDDEDVAAEERAAKKENKVAYAHLSNCLTSARDMVFIKRARTEEWPKGLASEVIRQMFARYKPEDRTSMAEGMHKMMNLKLSPKANPADLFTTLANLQDQYDTDVDKFSESTMIASVLRAIPDKYKVVVTSLQIAMGNNLSVESIEDAIILQYRNELNNSRSIAGTTDDGEVTLSSIQGVCYKCGKPGHRKADCPNKAKPGGGTFNKNRPVGQQKSTRRLCKTCGKEHAGPCWEDEANASKRPANWRSSKREGNIGASAVQNTGDIEYLLCNITDAEMDSYQLPDNLQCYDCASDVVRDDEVTPEWIQVFDAIRKGGQAVGHEFGLKNSNKEIPSVSFPNVRAMLSDPNIFIADSGSTTHATPDLTGMRNLRAARPSEFIEMGNGKQESAAQIGELPCVVCNQHGQEMIEVVLRDVTYSPSLKFNLFSTSKLQREGWVMIGLSDSITLEKDSVSICFDIVIPTEKGAIYCAYLKRGAEMINMAANPRATVTTMTIRQAHERFGHNNEDATRLAAKHMGIKILPGTMEPCDGCTMAKAKQKNVPRVNQIHVRSIKFGERMFSDISTIKQLEEGPAVTKPNWHILVDEATRMKFSTFYESKNGMVEKTCERFHRWKLAGHPVKFVRQDNAGENRLLQARSDSAAWKLGVMFEYTARDTPQQNHLAELAFATLINKSRAMLAAANIPGSLRYKLWKEAISTATDLDGLMVNDVNGKVKSKYEHAFGKNPKFASHLRTWGEAGTVKTKKTGTPKLSDRGVICVFIGYAKDHDGDCYKMWNPDTNGVHTTRDIIWLRRMYYRKDYVMDVVLHPIDLEEGAPAIIAPEEDDDYVPADADDDVSVGADTVQAGNPVVDLDVPAENAVVQTRSGRAVRAPLRLIEEIGAIAAQGQEQAASFEMALTNSEYNFYNIMTQLDEDVGELACLSTVKGIEFTLVGAALGGGFENTSELHVLNYKEAMASKDKDKWLKAMKEEHDRMLKHKVWKAVKPSSVPKGEKIITSTWANKRKSNGTFRARLNARGYEQIPGVHYDPKSVAAPVTNDITIRVVMTLMLMAGWFGELLDVKGAFLHGHFGPKEKPIHMRIPQGMEQYYPLNWILLLLKTIYGLCQSAFAFWKLLLSVFRAMGFERSKADPCLYFAWTKDGLVLWVSWVDDCLVVGSQKGVQIAKKHLTSHFECDELGNMDEYVGCKVERDWENRSIRLTQPVMLQSFQDEFNISTGGRLPNTPAIPGDHLVKGDEGTNVGADMQSHYRTGVGKLLHMMRWTRPEIQNSVRELSKYMSGATLAHVKAMHRVMDYCVATPKRGLLLKPERTWDGSPDFEFVITGRSDSDYAKDTDTRKSVSGSAVFLEGSPVVMRSSTQRSVTLSVTEAELAAAVQTAQDMMFVMRILESLGLKVKKPMILKLDNSGAHDLAHNWSVGGRTRHADVRMHFLRELKEEGVIICDWISGNDNPSDIFTKNLQGPLFNKHGSVFVGQDEYMVTTDYEAERETFFEAARQDSVWEVSRNKKKKYKNKSNGKAQTRNMNWQG